MAAAQPQGGFTVTVKHERTTHAVEVDGGTTVALLQTRLFLRSNVLPTRQKLMGFKGVPSPAPGATMSELKASGGMKLMMLPPQSSGGGKVGMLRRLIGRLVG